jgi:hypothetical protein
MLKMAHDGVRIGEIERQLSRSTDTVHRHLADMKMHCVRSDLWTDNERIELQSLIEDQLPVRAVAVILGRSHRSVRLKAQGICEPEPARGLTMSLRESTWIQLANVGAELSIEPAELAKVLLNIISRKNLFANILMLDGQRTSGDE